MPYDLQLDVRELEEIKRLIEAAENDTLQKVLKQVNIGLFQANLKEGDWFRSRKTGEVYRAIQVDHGWEQIEYFDPWKQKSEWMSLHDARPVTPEETEQAKARHEELYHRFHERCERIEAFLRKEYPSASPEQVDHIDDEEVPRDIIEVDGKIIGSYAWIDRFTVHYTVNMED